MKKFSKLTNQKVGEAPKIEVKLNEEDLFKSKILNLMDQLLTIRTYGPVDRYQRQGTIKIGGKELFLEALMDLMTNKSLKDQGKILENLKSNVKDWEVIDSQIEEVNSKIEESIERNKTLIHRNSFISLYENYNGDTETILSVVDNSSKKIKSIEKARIKAITAEYMANEGRYPKELFIKISEKYNQVVEKLK